MDLALNSPMANNEPTVPLNPPAPPSKKPLFFTTTEADENSIPTSSSSAPVLPFPSLGAFLGHSTGEKERATLLPPLKPKYSVGTPSSYMFSPILENNEEFAVFFNPALARRTTSFFQPFSDPSSETSQYHQTPSTSTKRTVSTLVLPRRIKRKKTVGKKNAAALIA
ncbi:unnamed protein product [Cylindrotheca closterium]|uniref:Uncharacterized protein n=1 Tax=Cylindrotheca closterium TaxID=2856 RepID=A0AAD2G8Y9_9STRA|nr:unnamed protein product [Cylindrotheca closterium]